MPSHRWSAILFGALAVLVLVAPVTGAAQIPASMSEPSIVTQLNTLINEIQLAMYLMKAAVESPNAGDVLVNATEVVAALAGAPESAVTGAPARIGIIQRLEDVLSCPELDTLLDIPRAEFVRDIKNAQVYAELSLQSTEEIHDGRTETENRASAKRAYAFLAATLGAESSPYTLGGVQTALGVLPALVAYAWPEDSLQEVIDSVLPGGTVFVQPGTYDVGAAMFIYKSITLARAPQADGDVILNLSRGPYSGGIYVSSASLADPIHVTMEGITITKAITGLYVSARATLTLRNVSVTDSVIGVRLSGSGKAILEDCFIQGNSDYGILATENATVEASECVIRENGSQEGADQIYRTSGGIMSDGARSISLISCAISDNLGFGLFSRGDPELFLVSCTLSRNASEGILLWDAALVNLRGNTIIHNGGAGIRAHSEDCGPSVNAYTSHYFQGRITGEGNHIPGADEVEGNAGGSVCPEDMAGGLTQSAT